MSLKEFEDLVDGIESWYSSEGKDLSSSNGELYENGFTLSTLIDYPGFNWETFGPHMIKVLKLSVQIFGQTSIQDLQSTLISTIEFCLENKKCRDFFIDQRFISVMFKTASKISKRLYPNILFIFTLIYKNYSNILQQIDFNFLLTLIEQALENDKDFGIDFVQNYFPSIIESFMKNIEKPLNNNKLVYSIYSYIVPGKSNWTKAYKALPLLLAYPQNYGQKDNQEDNLIPFEFSSLYLQFFIENENIEIPPNTAITFFAFALNNEQFKQLFFEKIPNIFAFVEEREWNINSFFNMIMEIYHMQPRELPKSISPHIVDMETQTEKIEM